LAGRLDLDCLGTLAANEMFSKPDAEEITGSMDVLYDRILSGIGQIKDSVSMLVVISNELFSDGIIYDGMTESYLHLMGRLHCALAVKADVAVECAAGCVITHKGSLLL
jgi:adenosylcobinamide kinase/adenosylcobinamide-phosphate guanylyltransferase